MVKFVNVSGQKVEYSLKRIPCMEVKLNRTGNSMVLHPSN